MRSNVGPFAAAPSALHRSAYLVPRPPPDPSQLRVISDILEELGSRLNEATQLPSLGASRYTELAYAPV